MKKSNCRAFVLIWGLSFLLSTELICFQKDSLQVISKEPAIIYKFDSIFANGIDFWFFYHFSININFSIPDEINQIDDNDAPPKIIKFPNRNRQKFYFKNEP